MGFAGSDKNSTTTLEATNTLVNDSRIGASDNAVVTRQGNINLTNAPVAVFEANRDIALKGLSVAENFGGLVANIIKNQSDNNSSILDRTLTSQAGLAETKISDGANITAKTLQIGLVVIGGIVALYFFIKKS